MEDLEKSYVERFVGERVSQGNNKKIMRDAEKEKGKKKPNRNRKGFFNINVILISPYTSIIYSIELIIFSKFGK